MRRLTYGKVLLVVFCVLVFPVENGEAGVDEWTSHGPRGGAIFVFAVAPTAPSTVYARNFGGGAFKSTDSGATWSVASTDLVGKGGRPLAIDPLDPSTLYAATRGGGVWKSTDGAATWSRVNGVLPDSEVQVLAIDPVTPDTLYAGTVGGGVFKSVDGGVNWVPVNTGLTDFNVKTLIINPLSPDTLYAGTDAGGVFKSTDGAVGWADVNAGLVDPGITTLVIDPLTPSTLYAGTTDGGVFKTVDAAGTWAPADSGICGTVVQFLVINPENPATLYAATPSQPSSTSDNVCKTTDGGNSWAPADEGLSGFPLSVPIPLAIDPLTPSNLYVALRIGGAFRSLDGAGNWTSMDLVASEAQGVAIDTKTTPTTVYASTLDGVFKSIDGGGSWGPTPTGGPPPAPVWDMATLVVDPSGPQTVFAVQWRGSVFKTTNGGVTWDVLDNGLQSLSVLPLVMDPSDPSILYAGDWPGEGGQGVYKTIDGGGSWFAANEGLPAVGVLSLAVDPEIPGTIYAGTEGNGVYKTANGGENWSLSSDGLTDAEVATMAVDPLDTSTVYAGTPNGLYKSTDGGATWTLSNGEAGFYYLGAIAIIPSSPSTVFAASTAGIFKSTDGAETWTTFNDGLTSTPLSDFVIDHSSCTLYAAVYNSGAFVRDFDVDQDGDGLTLCQDCDDFRPSVYPGAPQICDRLNNDCNDPTWPTPPAVELDDDADGFAECTGDCDDTDPDTYPGAAEVNDGQDNQCPGEFGFGVVDETSGTTGFTNGNDRNEISWDPQLGATSYEAVRSSGPMFISDCLTAVVTEPRWVDLATPVQGRAFFYLNRPLSPNVGSWGQDSTGAGRDLVCVDPFCGDEVINPPGETCDPPGQPLGQPNECRSDCTFCGDGSLDPGEDCDDGNNVSGDGCESNCTLTCVSAPDGLVAWWPGDTDAKDIQGGNDGILVNGAVAGVPGQVGGAFNFDGGDDFVDVASNLVFDITDALTMEAWINLTTLSWDQKILSYYLPYEMGIFNDKLEFLPGSEGGVSVDHRQAPGGTVLQTNTWYHVVTTWDGDTITSYVNGAVDRSAAYSGPLDVGTNNFSIGSEPNGGTVFGGLIDEAALYARALTAAEVQAIYNAGSAGKCKLEPVGSGAGAVPL